MREGDRLWVRRFYVSIEPKESRFGGQSAVSVRRRVYWNDRGELIAIWDADFVHAERDKAAKRQKTVTEPPKQHIYTNAEIDEVDAHYAAETVRGAEVRYVEDASAAPWFSGTSSPG